jgi:hypothetical protein
MEKLSIKTNKKGGAANSRYTENLQSVTTFLRHSEDRITVINGETVNIEIYHNGKCLFAGDKYELFKKLNPFNL